jgi:hypothetical protein
MYLIYAGFNYSAENGFVSVVNEFISDRSLIWDWLQEHGASLLEWLKQPRSSSLSLVNFGFLLWILINI